jgi:hypothetical protein
MDCFKNHGFENGGFKSKGFKKKGSKKEGFEVKISRRGGGGKIKD